MMAPESTRPSAPEPGAGHGAATAGLYTTPSEAVREVQESYKKWSGQLTQRSFELSMAVIAANWATFGAINPLLANPWAKLSVGIVVLGLVLNILATWLMTHWLAARINYAEADLSRWADEFRQLQSKKDPWPFTGRIESTATALRIGKTFIPLCGGVLYICALLFAS